MHEQFGASFALESVLEKYTVAQNWALPPKTEKAPKQRKIMLIGLGIHFVIQTAFLTLALWILVKLQKFQFNFPGLVASAAVATVFDLIPFVGHYLAVVVLFLCIAKVTRERGGDVIFTVGVSYALTFGMNLFLLASLLGDLRVHARSRDSVASVTAAGGNNEELDDTKATTNATAAGKPTAVASPAQVTDPAPVVKAPPPEGLVLKGIIKGPKASSVMLSAGAKTYTLFVGDSTHIDIGKDSPQVALVKVKDATTAVLNIDGEEVELSK
jgi:hypothetical protein